MPIPDPSLRIAVIGCGIGGAATAIALQHAGFPCEIYERAPALLRVGGGIDLWPNATRVLRQFGVLDALLPQAVRNRHFRIRSRRGHTLLKAELGAYDAPSLGVHRADLLAALQARLDPARLHLDHELTRLEQLADGGVELWFRNSARERFDAVIGADGLRSRVRALLQGGEPVFRGYNFWSGVSPLPCPDAESHNSQSWGRGLRFGIVPVGQGQTAWYASVNAATPQPDPPEERRERLLERFAGWHEPIAALIESTPTILHHGAFDLPSLPRWSHGSATLLGDAAHATTPNLAQGACMAIEDAACLAACLHADRVPARAFLRYERQRRSRTRGVVLKSRWMGGLGQVENPLGASARAAAVALVPGPLVNAALGSLFDFSL